MSLYERMEQDTRRALKKGDSLRVSVLRMALSTIKTLQIEKNIKAMDDDGVIQILQRHVKQRRESIEQFTKGSRIDLADKEKAEQKILEEYLPKQLNDEEVTCIIKTVMAESGAVTKSDTGKVMKAVMERVKSRSDGKTVSRLVGQILK